MAPRSPSRLTRSFRSNRMVRGQRSRSLVLPITGSASRWGRYFILSIRDRWRSDDCFVRIGMGRWIIPFIFLLIALKSAELASGQKMAAVAAGILLVIFILYFVVLLG